MNISTPSTEQTDGRNSSSKKVDGRAAAGLRQKMRKTTQVHREQDKYRRKYEECLKEMRKYKKQYERLNKIVAERNPPAQLTPKTKVNRFLSGKHVDVEVRKKLVFGEVVQSQLAQHYGGLQTNKEKRSLKIIIATKIIKKYRLVTAAWKLLRCGPETRAAHVTNKKKAVISAHRVQVQQLLESDDNSTMAHGKRDTITRNKIKMQK